MCEFDYQWTPTVRAFKHQIPYRRQTLKERDNPRHKQRSTRSRWLCSHRLKTPQKERIIYADTCCPCLVLQKSASQANSTLLPPNRHQTTIWERKRAENTRENAKMLKTMQQNQVLTDKLYKKGEMLFICARCHTGATVFSAVRDEEGVRRHKTILQKMVAQKAIQLCI